VLLKSDSTYFRIKCSRCISQPVTSFDVLEIQGYPTSPNAHESTPKEIADLIWGLLRDDHGELKKNPVDKAGVLK